MNRLRPLIVVLALALVAVGCGTENSADRKLMRYGYAPGDTLAYDASGSVKGSMLFEGELEPGIDQGEITLDLDFAARIGYSISEGADPTLLVVRITQEITRFDGMIDAMGESETLTLADLDGMAPTVVEVTMDESGAIVGVSIDGEALPGGDALGGLGILGSLGDLSGLGSQLLNPQHLGPQFPDEAVGIGDEWTTDLTSGPLGLAFDQQVRNRVGAEETIGDRATFRIDTTVTTAAAELGLADLLGSLLGGLEGSGADELGLDPEALGELLAAMGIQLLLTVDASQGVATTWFDPADGLVVRHEGTSPFGLAVSMSGIPDTGDLALDLDFTITENLALVE